MEGGYILDARCVEVHERLIEINHTVMARAGLEILDFWRTAAVVSEGTGIGGSSRGESRNARCFVSAGNFHRVADWDSSASTRCGPGRTGTKSSSTSAARMKMAVASLGLMLP